MSSTWAARASRSRVRLLLVAAVVLPAIASGQAWAGADAGGRVLRFPPDRSLGRVKLYRGPITNPDDLPGNHQWDEWEFFHEARGHVTIPAGRIVKFEVSSPGKVRDLSPLRKLGPNDLYSVAVDGVQARIPSNPDQTVLPHLGGLTGLKELETIHVGISGKGLRHLERLSSLKVLSIRYTNQSLDAGLPSLSKLRSLEHLELEGGCTDAGLRGLTGATTLTTLVLGVNDIEGPGLVHLEKLPALRSLTLIGQVFSGEGLAHIRRLSTLTHLELFGSEGITDASLVHLSGLTALAELRFTNVSRITDAGMVHLKPLRLLRKLEFAHSQVTDAGLAQLGEMKLLESLRLPIGITDAGLAWLAQSFKLKELNCGGRQITDEGLRHLARLRSLERLFIGGKGVTDAGMDSVAQLTNLRSLGLISCPITGEGLAKLGPLKSLASLQVVGARLPVSALKHLNALPNLAVLRIGEVEQDSTSMDISRLTKLEELTIEPAKGSQIRDEDLACLSQLQNLRNLQFAYTDRMAVGDQGVKHLAGLTNLDTLVIGSNVSDGGLGYLKHMNKLHRLTIQGEFTDQGLRQLEGLTNLGVLRIGSARPLSRAALNRLQQALPNLYSFQEMKPSRR